MIPKIKRIMGLSQNYFPANKLELSWEPMCVFTIEGTDIRYQVFSIFIYLKFFLSENTL